MCRRAAAVIRLTISILDLKHKSIANCAVNNLVGSNCASSCQVCVCLHTGQSLVRDGFGMAENTQIHEELDGVWIA